MNINKNKFLNLNFENFFSGKVIAKGILILRFPRKSVKNLNVTFKGFFRNNELKLKEHYIENEKKIIRNWKFKKISNILYHGEEKNVKGTIIVNVEKNRVFMKYYFKLIVYNFTITVFIRDFMYLINEKEIINTTYVSKFGIRLAEVILHYKKNS